MLAKHRAMFVNINICFLTCITIVYVTIYISLMAQIMRLMKSKFFWRKRICFWKVSTCKMELHTSKMVASLEYSKIQNLICNNSITHRIMTDTYNSVHMKYNNKHNISHDYGQSVYIACSIIFKIHFTVQLFFMYCLLYKKCHSPSATLASLSFFKRSGTYNLYSFGRVGYKNDVKTAKIYRNTYFLCKHLIM